MTLQEKIIVLAEKAKNPPSWWWKVLGGLIFLVMVIWLRYLLSKRSEALAALKTEAAKKKLAADQAAVAAQLEKDTQKRVAAELAAGAAMAEARKAQDNILALDKEHILLVSQLQAVADKDWTTLNKLAGVKNDDPLRTIK